MDDLKPGNVVPGKAIPVKLGIIGPVVDIPYIRCECGGDAIPVDNSYDGQQDTIKYLCPECRTETTERVH